MITIDAEFARGKCPVQAFGVLDDGSAPVVLLFMDGFGPRPALIAMAERLVDQGYRILLPHLFYDHLADGPLSAESILGGGEDRIRLMAMLARLDQAAVDADVTALLKLVEERLGTDAPIGATGYCMGGRYAITAATLSPRVKMAASFHGANLAPLEGDSAHRRLAGVQASIYVGVAGIDPMFDGAEEGRLAAALRDANVDHMIESYAGAPHGFVMSDLPMYRAEAAARHWLRLTDGLREAFSRTT